MIHKDKIEDKSFVWLRFHRQSILDDVENKASVIALTLGDEQQRIKPLIDDMCRGRSKDLVLRAINLAYQVCFNLLHKYTDVPVESRSNLDDTLGAPITYEMAMGVPKDFPKGKVALLKNLIHEFIVARALYEMLYLIWPDAGQIWLQKSQMYEEEIKDNMTMTGVFYRKPQIMYINV